MSRTNRPWDTKGLVLAIACSYGQSSWAQGEFTAVEVDEVYSALDCRPTKIFFLVLRVKGSHGKEADVSIVMW
jgi:hypothetical protein